VLENPDRDNFFIFRGDNGLLAAICRMVLSGERITLPGVVSRQGEVLDILSLMPPGYVQARRIKFQAVVSKHCRMALPAPRISG